MTCEDKCSTAKSRWWKRHRRKSLQRKDWRGNRTTRVLVRLTTSKSKMMKSMVMMMILNLPNPSLKKSENCDEAADQEVHQDQADQIILKSKAGLRTNRAPLMIKRKMRSCHKQKRIVKSFSRRLYRKRRNKRLQREKERRNEFWTLKSRMNQVIWYWKKALMTLMTVITARISIRRLQNNKMRRVFSPKLPSWE